MKTSSIYDHHSGETICEGLSSSLDSDQARLAAQRIADDQGQPVLLVDHGTGEESVVEPRGGGNE